MKSGILAPESEFLKIIQQEENSCGCCRISLLSSLTMIDFAIELKSVENQSDLFLRIFALWYSVWWIPLPLNRVLPVLDSAGFW